MLGSLLNIVEETSDYIVVDKPGELVCHPTKGDAFSSLIGRLRLYFDGTEVDPRFVNRLDRETSGLVVISKNRPYHKLLCRELETAQKIYHAVVEGRPAEDEGIIDQPIGPDDVSPVAVKQTVRPDGRPSRTRWRVLARDEDATLLEVRLETGRMHQIRVHLSWLGHPLVGDKLYGHDETLYLELAEKSWTARHAQCLDAERQLLSAVALVTKSHRWTAKTPADILGYRDWNLASDIRGQASKT